MFVPVLACCLPCPHLQPQEAGALAPCCTTSPAAVPDNTGLWAHGWGSLSISSPFGWVAWLRAHENIHTGRPGPSTNTRLVPPGWRCLAPSFPTSAAPGLGQEAEPGAVACSPSSPSYTDPSPPGLAPGDYEWSWGDRNQDSGNVQLPLYPLLNLNSKRPHSGDTPFPFLHKLDVRQLGHG